jgi:hypothetical protein
VAVVSAQELVKTFNCKTPGCEGEARSSTGRHAYCLTCRVHRGTALPDGTPIEAQRPRTPGSGKRREAKGAHGPFESAALELAVAGRSLDFAIAQYQLAKPALKLAAEAWREALEQLPKALPGAALGE